MTEKFTPSPWVVEPDLVYGSDRYEVYPVDAQDDLPLAAIELGVGLHSHAAESAALSLLTAAPELYKHLSSAVEMLSVVEKDKGMYKSQILHEMELTLRKARGEQ